MLEIDLGKIGDYIIIIGGIVVAIEHIYNFTAKPTSYFKKKRMEKEEKWHYDYLSQILPKMLEEHDLQIRDKYKAERQDYLVEIKAEVTSELAPQIEEIRQINMQQNENIETLARSSKDVLREKIMAIYHRNKKNRSMTLYEREALNLYFQDYKAQHGNNYIDKYYSRMENWKTLEEDYVE